MLATVVVTTLYCCGGLHNGSLHGKVLKNGASTRVIALPLLAIIYYSIATAAAPLRLKDDVAGAPSPRNHRRSARDSAPYKFRLAEETQGLPLIN